MRFDEVFHDGEAVAFFAARGTRGEAGGFAEELDAHGDGAAGRGELEGVADEIRGRLVTVGGVAAGGRFSANAMTRVEKHREATFAKLGVENRTSAAAVALVRMETG